MNTDVRDLRNTIVPKSDQLNTDQLLGGPLVITVSDVRVGGGDDQPVSIYYETDRARPFKPCKTMRKVLILAWGPDGTKWIGKSMELYNEPSVKFGGELVGGIRISRLTDIPADIKVSLTATKGRKTLHEIGILELSNALAGVLEAIGEAFNRETLALARRMAEKLQDPNDIAMALAAYKKKVDALKEKAAAATAPTAPTIDPKDAPDVGAEPPAVTYAVLADRITRCDDRMLAEIILDDSRDLPQEQQDDLQKLFDEKFPKG